MGFTVPRLFHVPLYQNTDHPIRSLNNSNALIPASEFPAAFNSGDHTHTVNCPGTTATMPPPTPTGTGGRDAPPPVDPIKSLDAVRQLIVQAGIKAKERQQKTAEKVAEAKRMGKPAGFGSINIPLSGPRVEVRHFTRLRCVWFR